MIFTGILSAIISLFGAIFNLLHIGTVSTIPFADSYLVTGRGYLEWWIVYFPPLATMLAGFLTILAFKTLMLTLRLFRIIR